VGGWHGGHSSHGWGGAQWGGPWGGSHRPGPPPWVQDLVRSFGGPDLGPQRSGPRVRRGDVRSAILDVLAGGDMNGYQVIQTIQERSGGGWKPSPGSVYPTIQQLEDEGLVEATEDEGGRRTLRLSDSGRAYVEERAEELAETWRPFDAPDPSVPLGGISNLRPAISQTMAALWQVMTTGTDQQRAEAIDILNDARRRLYGLLAEGDAE